MKKWDDFLPAVMPDVPGCPPDKIVNAIRYAARDICDFSQLWIEEMSSKLSLVANQALVDLAPESAEQSIITVTRLGFYASGATKAYTVTGPMSEAEMDVLYTTWREDKSEGTINTLTAFLLPPKGGYIRVVPIPVVSQANALIATLALKPSPTSSGGPDFLFDDWIEQIAHGALWRLMAEPNVKWSNSELAAYHKNEYEEARANMRHKADKGGGNRIVIAEPVRKFA